MGERQLIVFGTVSTNITIGSGSIVGADAVVVRDIPDDVVAYGNPARVARSLR